jgi:hypothetical protein
VFQCKLASNDITFISIFIKIDKFFHNFLVKYRRPDKEISRRTVLCLCVVTYVIWTQELVPPSSWYVPSVLSSILTVPQERPEFNQVPQLRQRNAYTEEGYLCSPTPPRYLHTTQYDSG